MLWLAEEALVEKKTESAKEAYGYQQTRPKGPFLVKWLEMTYSELYSEKKEGK